MRINPAQEPHRFGEVAGRLHAIPEAAPAGFALGGLFPGHRRRLGRGHVHRGRAELVIDVLGIAGQLHHVDQAAAQFRILILDPPGRGLQRAMAADHRRPTITIRANVATIHSPNIPIRINCGKTNSASMSISTNNVPNDTHVASTAVLKSVKSHHF